MTHRSLLQPGLHTISEAELDNHFLSSFPSSTTRPQIIDGLRRYLEALRTIGIDFEIWLDGSFTTDKLDPEDVDLVVFASLAQINGLPQPTKELVNKLFINQLMRQLFRCDVYFCISEDQQVRSYWRGWFGFDREELPKGIAQLAIHA